MNTAPGSFGRGTSAGPPPPPPPRRIEKNIVDWNTGFALTWGAGYGGIPALALVGMMIAFGPPWNDWILNQRGLPAVATPYQVESTGVSLNDESLMRIRVRFADRKGKTRTTAVTTVNEALLGAARKQQPIQIEYDPEDPSMARLRGGANSMLSEPSLIWVLPMLLLVFVIPGLGAYFWGLRRLFRLRRIYRHGVAALATVVSHEETSSSQNYENLYLAHYEFFVSSRRHVGQIKALHPPPINAQLWILHDPERPDLNLAA
jgi:hypothetical protein